MAIEPKLIAVKLVELLREPAKNQTKITNTQWLMEETLKKLADNKFFGEQNGHNVDLVSGKSNPQPACSRPSMLDFPPWTEAQHEGRQPTFKEMQEKLRED